MGILKPMPRRSGMALFSSANITSLLVIKPAGIPYRESAGRLQLHGGAGEQVAFDIFRFDADGKIAEHWDVMETIADPSTWQNQNGKF